MVVYLLRDRLSTCIISIVVPSERAVYNTTVFSQEGYFG